MIKPVVKFWFEFASTYSYLSAMRIQEEAEQRQVSIAWTPFLLGPIFAEQGWNTSPFKVYPAKGANMWRDMERRADKYGLAFNRPPADRADLFPQHSVLATRVALVGLGEGWGVDFIKTVYVAEWVNQDVISDPQVIAACVNAVGADADLALSRAQLPQTKAQLRASTDEAMKSGLFGAPSFTVGDELFWGDDRLEDALDWAAGPRSRDAARPQ